MTVGALVRDTRTRLGLTQGDLAKRAGVSLGSVRDLEQGRSSSPRPRLLDALGGALGMGHQDLSRLRQLARPAPLVPAPTNGGPLRISVLGPLGLTRAGQEVSIGAGRHRIVLARLAMTPDRPVGRDELIHLLWADDAPPSAANVLQTHVSRLRRLLTPGMVELAPGGYRLQATAAELDLVAYRERLAGGRDPQVPPSVAFDLVHDALEMWHGDVPAAGVPELEDDPLVTELADERVEAAIRLTRLGETLHREPQVLPVLRRLAPRHPYHESLHARLVVALAASGQQAAALEVYDEVRARLADELGLDPGTELREARQAVLRTRPDEVRAPVVRPWQAPAPPLDFTGRTAELHDVGRALRYPSGPSVVCVISGMAGVGKTSLALQAARSVRQDFPDGQIHLDLRGADRQPVGTPYALARLLRAAGVPGRAVPVDPDEAAALWRSTVSDRRLLVVLDNARNAAQVRPLLPGPGGSAVLITSRNRCAELDGAHLVELGTLSVTEALGMLGDRAADDATSAEALVEACGLLPVALRVIASRLKDGRVAMHDLLDRLADKRSRLARFSIGDIGVQASFELSYQELSTPVSSVFRAGALIPGETFHPAAVAALAGVGEQDATAALHELTAENLVQCTESGRFRYHDLLRLYAAQRPGDDRDPAALGPLFDWYLARTAAAMRLVYAEMVRLPLDIPADPAGFTDVNTATAWLHEELTGLLAAIDLAAAGPHRARAWQLADQLRGYFFVHRDVVSWLGSGQTGLAAAQAAGDDLAQAAMHQTIGQAYWAAGETQRAGEAYRAGVDAARRGGWLIGEAYLLHNLGLIRQELGQPTEAEQLYRQALEISEGPEFSHIRAVTLNDLGAMCNETGRLTEAVVHFKAALALNRGAARRRSAVVNLGNLGMVLRLLEEFDTAREHLTAALDYHRTTGALNGQMATLDELSLLYQQQAEWSAALSAATEAVSIAVRLRDLRSEAGVLATLGFALLGARAIEDAAERFTRCLQLCRDNGYLYFEVQAGVGLAEVRLASGDPAEARVVAEAALDLADRKKYRIFQGDARLALARTAMTTGDLARAERLCKEAATLHEGLPARLRAGRELLLAAAWRH
ncbi:BTAD domain-containing putative transcriptional regulator [Winogradskya consettensis]|nr:BTAD domain-containing putative transcriptional regulator [Actinoplanes consettensis]